MGISSIIAGALKKVPWTSLAMNYGPELMRRFGGKVLTRDMESVEQDEFAEAEKRIRELEALCEEQRQAINTQHEQLELLTRTCSALRSQLKLYQGVSATLAIAVVVLGILLAT